MATSATGKTSKGSVVVARVPSDAYGIDQVLKRLHEWQSHSPIQAPGVAALTVSGCGRPVTVQPKSGVWTPSIMRSGRVLSDSYTSCPTKRIPNS